MTDWPVPGQQRGTWGTQLVEKIEEELGERDTSHSGLAATVAGHTTAISRVDPGVAGDDLAHISWNDNTPVIEPAITINVRHPKFGATGDGVTDDTDAIEAAIAAAAGAGVGTATIMYPGGQYRITRSIRTYTGIRHVGVGASRPGGSNGNGTYIDAADVATAGGHAFYTGTALSDFLHWGGFENMAIEFAPGDGIHIGGGMGEVAIIDRVQCNHCGADGISIAGPSTPLILGDISVQWNGQAGLHISSQTVTHVQVKYLAGDNNIHSLMWIDTLAGSSSVQVLGWKAERWDNGSHPVGHNRIFVISQGNLANVHLGMGRIHNSEAVAGESVVYQEHSGSAGDHTAYVRWDSIGCYRTSGSGGYTYIYNDDHKSLTEAYPASENTNIGSRMYGAGAMQKIYTYLPEFPHIVLNSQGFGGASLYPESRQTANPGSFVGVDDGTAWIKASGTGNTGWLPVAIVRSGVTGSRPLATAVPIGAGYFDTTLGKPIWSNGTDWKDATGMTV